MFRRHPQHSQNDLCVQWRSPFARDTDTVATRLGPPVSTRCTRPHRSSRRTAVVNLSENDWSFSDAAPGDQVVVVARSADESQPARQ
jgi:hypothetical protein